MQTNKIHGSTGLIAVLGLLSLLVGLIVMLVLPDIRRTAWIILGLGVLLLAAAVIIDFRYLGRSLTGRRGRFSAGTTVMASIFIGIILVVNAISIGNYQRFDLTGLAQFTLTSQTKDVLSKLKTPVQILLFVTPADPLEIDGYITNLLAEYKNYTDQLSIKTIDPDENPDQARQYDITEYSTVVFESEKGRRLVPPEEIIITSTDQQGNQQMVGAEAEHPFTSAILEVSGTTQKKVYFLTGHGESDINSQATSGYSRAKIGLQDNLYKVEPLDLKVTSKIPEDAAALIIAAPRASITSGEIAIIEGYLKNGGWLMILTNPDSSPEINQLLSAWGVNIEEGSIIDPSSYVTPSIDSPSVPNTRNLFGLAKIYFPGATAIIPQENAADKISMQPLAWSSNESWLDKDFNPQKEPKFDVATERKGPLAIGVVIAARATQQDRITRLIVIGDSDFATNQHFFSGNNGDFFVTAVKLLTEGKEIVSIERKVLPFRRLVVGPEAQRFISYTSIGLLPLIVLVIGSIIWWQRR
ncbi:MAG: GldG family protein [Chloroflexi bacterium]|nr:GldG family protein [Chloroflexota bacterium]